MSDYPKTHLMIYQGQRVAQSGNIVHLYAYLDDKGFLTGETALFKKRIKGCWGIGTAANVVESKENSFAIADAKYFGSVFDDRSPNKLLHLRSDASEWQALHAEAGARKEMNRKAKGEDAWEDALRPIARAYRQADLRGRAIILAKVIERIQVR